MNKYYKDLSTLKSVDNKYHHSKTEFVTTSTIRNIHKLLRSAFNQAIKWELLDHNPVINCTLPKKEEKERAIWDIDTLSNAHIMDDDRRLNTEKMQNDFYENKDSVEQIKPDFGVSDEAISLAKALEQSPELMNMLKTLLNK